MKLTVVKVLVAVTAATVIGTMGLLSKDREFAKVVQTSARNRKVPAEKPENCAEEIKAAECCKDRNI